MYYTYILYSPTADKYYIGFTSNLESRISDHNSSFHKIKFTRKNAHDWKLVYFEKFDNKHEAVTREKNIKRMKSRIYIEKLIKSSPA